MALSQRLVGSIILILSCAGCGSQRDAVPGNIAPGSIEDVTARIDSGGVSAQQQLAEIGVIPVTGNVKPVIPLIKPPEVISFYVFPRKSRDGMSFRDGVWIHRVIREFSWGVDDAMRNDRLKLSSLINLRLDDQGQLVVDQAKSIEPPPQDLDGIRDMARKLPWRPGDGTQPVARTTVVYPATGTSVTTTQPISQSPVSPSGAVNMQEIETALRNAQERTRALQRQNSPSGAAGGAAAPQASPVAPSTQPAEGN